MREVRVNVVNDTKGEVESVVALEVPAGWTATPAEQKVALTREDESQTVRFQLRAPKDAAPGEYAVTAHASVGAATYNRGYQTIEYPHTTRQHIFHAAATRLKVMDVRTTPNLTVGYIMGVGDEVPAALTQLGARVEFLQADDLGLGRPVAVPGDRDRRARLRAPCRPPREQRAAHRLRAERRAPGRAVQQVRVQRCGVRPARGEGHLRSRDRRERAGQDPRAGRSAADHAQQDYGLGVAGMGPGARAVLPRRARSRYRDLVELEDPFPYNAGAKTRCPRRAHYGKGRWIYVGLGLWRELPAGVDGAYQLLANLISPK